WPHRRGRRGWRSPATDEARLQPAVCPPGLLLHPCARVRGPIPAPSRARRHSGELNRWRSFTAAPGANDEVNENLEGFSILVADVQSGTQTLGGNWVIVWIEDDDEVSGLVDA